MGKRAKIIVEIERAIAKLEDRPGLCLYYAHHTARILCQHGYKAVIQAGSLQWPRLKDDDGVSATHFSYMWSPNDLASQVSARMGGLPEMHVWAGIVDQQQLVDFSTRHLVKAAEVLDLYWTAAAPPQYLWCPASQLPEGVVYRPDRDATILACRILKKHLIRPTWKLLAAKACSGGEKGR